MTISTIWKRTLAPLLVIILVVISSCGDDEAPRDGGRDLSAGTDVGAQLRQTGKITHIRYTTYTPPWPTRTEAWIDWDHNRTRSWNVQWSDSPTNPSICTAIRTNNEWYPCLPSGSKVTGEDALFWSAFYPTVPLRSSDSELSVPFGLASISESHTSPTPVQLGAKHDPRRAAQGTDVIDSWAIASQLDVPCRRGKQTGEASFEYTHDADGAPISEFIVIACGEETDPLFGVLYHDIEFVEASSLPAGFFDIEETRKSLVEDELSAAATQLGTMFWLGNGDGEWKLDGVEHDADRARVRYTRGDGADGPTAVLYTRKGRSVRLCDEARAILNDPFDGSLCHVEDYGGEYSVVWRAPEADVWLEIESYDQPVTSDDVLALAGNIAVWEHKASGPLLTEDAVRNFVADSLAFVCPGQRLQLREAAADASFDFDQGSGEWRGTFGVFGEYAVPDSQPAAIPVSNRDDVESTLSHNAAQFADCVSDEAPTPQAGDDEFGVTFAGADDTGVSFNVTGADSDTEGSLLLCIVSGKACTLTDPRGERLDMRAIDANELRPQVFEIHVGINREQLVQPGEWVLSLDLGEGRVARTAFETQ